MKYPNWNEYDSAKKWKAVADEVNLETNNATTKADLTNMVKFLGREAARLQAEVYKLKAVVDAAREDLAIVCTSGETCAVCQNVENRGDNFPCRVSDGWCCGDKWVWRGEQALAELDKEDTHD